MSSVDDESPIHFEERADLLFQGMRRPERTMSGTADPSLNKRKEKEIPMKNISNSIFRVINNL